MRRLIENWRGSLSKKVENDFGITIAPADISMDFPPRPELGDVATNIAFIVAKKCSKNPAEVAKKLQDVVLESVGRVEVKGPYINIFLDRPRALEYLMGKTTPSSGADEKVIIEHTNINPNKAAHIGHLRNAVLGDTLVRALRFLGKKVEVQNYIDDTGVQVADVVVAFQEILGFGVEDIKREAEGGKPFDIFCWELYAKSQKFYEQDAKNLEKRYKVLHLIEEGNNETAGIAEFVAEKMVNCHLKTMDRLGIRYDLLPHESDILKNGFWDQCFKMLKESGSIEYIPPESEEKMRGCYVMRLSGNKTFEGLSDADKVIVRSNGTVTYLGKDLAYQLWKLGVLGKDFGYKILENAPYKIWRTTLSEKGSGGAGFGGGKQVYNVIDVRQSYLQKIVAEGLKMLGYVEEAEASVHFSYEMVALSTKFIREEIEKGNIKNVDEKDLNKPFIEMSGRKGLAYVADHLIDALFERARKEIEKREAVLDENEVSERSKILARSALKYYILKFSRNQIVAFDLNEALSFEGETGPYIQYAAVRAANILRKAAERGEKIPSINDARAAGELIPLLDNDGWGILSLFLRLPFAVERAVELLELNLIAKSLYEIAHSFHNYYHKAPVLQEEDEQLRRSRLLFVAIFAALFRESLETLLGIETPQRM
jgi:arginyl-tRNA synthetase